MPVALRSLPGKVIPDGGPEGDGHHITIARLSEDERRYIEVPDHYWQANDGFCEGPVRRVG